MKKILALAAMIIALATCAEATETPTLPPFAFQIKDLSDLHIVYDANIEVSQPYRVDYNQLSQLS